MLTTFGEVNKTPVQSPGHARHGICPPVRPRSKRALTCSIGHSCINSGQSRRSRAGNREQLASAGEARSGASAHAVPAADELWRCMLVIPQCLVARMLSHRRCRRPAGCILWRHARQRAAMDLDASSLHYLFATYLDGPDIAACAQVRRAERHALSSAPGAWPTSRCAGLCALLHDRFATRGATVVIRPTQAHLRRLTSTLNACRSAAPGALWPPRKRCGGTK